MMQNNCWSYFAFRWTLLAEAVKFGTHVLLSWLWHL